MCTPYRCRLLRFERMPAPLHPRRQEARPQLFCSTWSSLLFAGAKPGFSYKSSPSRICRLETRRFDNGGQAFLFRHHAKILSHYGLVLGLSGSSCRKQRANMATLRSNETREGFMGNTNIRMLMGAAGIAVALTASAAIAQAPPAPPPPPPPIMPPSLPITFAANLMTQQDATALGVQWKTMDARIVDVKPVEGAMPQYKTTYDIAPHAGEAGFDDSKWPAIAPQDLA